MAQYPNVECAAHPGEAKPGYGVCWHADRKMREMATPTAIGIIVCDACDAAFGSAVMDGKVKIACADCLGDEVATKGEA